MKLNIFLKLSFSLFAILLFACREDDAVKVNQAPDTFFSVKEFNLTGDNRLNSIVRISWYGIDPDGYIVGYELSEDGMNWGFTNSTDSTFRFNLSSGSDTSNIQLFVRAIDNNGNSDPDPGTLTIPIKNTPPTIEFDEDLDFQDTAFLVATSAWKAEDIDGIETITKVSISLNGADWYDLNRSRETFSLVVDISNQSDTSEALLYYDTDNEPQAEKVPGLLINDSNVVYIKTVDQAGAESKIDTSNTFFMKGKVNDVLVVAGVDIARDDYKEFLDSARINYDFIDYTVKNGANQPLVWNITFKLLLLQYSKLFFFSDETAYSNPYTNVVSILLESASASLQTYANLGGKYLVSTSFFYSTPIDGFVGVLPITSVSSKNYGSARFYRDSSATSPLSNFPTLKINQDIGFLSGLGVFNIDETDTEVLYTAALSDRKPTTPWPDTKIIASGRRFEGKLNQIFFNVQLYELNGNDNIDDLFNQIFNVEFK